MSLMQHEAINKNVYNDMQDNYTTLTHKTVSTI